MPSPTLSFFDLIENAASLSLTDFEKFMQTLRARRAQRGNPNVLSKQEADLLKKISSPFSPEKKERSAFLNAKIWDETLSEIEHIELLQLTEAHEKWAAERMDNLMKLAMLRNVEYAVLARQLGIAAPTILHA